MRRVFTARYALGLYTQFVLLVSVKSTGVCTEVSCGKVNKSYDKTLKLKASQHSESLRTGRSADRIPAGEGIFCTRPDRPWNSPIPPYNAHWVSFPGVKPPGRGVNNPPQSMAKIKERAELYIYNPCGQPWLVLG